MPLRAHLINWGLFIALSVIWGSSFILMKVGLNTLTAYQVAALRLFSAGIVLMPVAIRKIRQVPLNKLTLIILSGLLGSFFPAFLFCLAETKIDSSLTGILNACTPIFTIITGALFFNSMVKWHKVVGILIGFLGLTLLFLSKGNISIAYLSFSGLVLLATVFYGLNVNMVSRYLKEVGSLNIAAFAFAILTIPSFLILLYTGYFGLPLLSAAYLTSTTASAVLGIMGTALASICFYMLVKRAGVLFASMVTYGIPFVAVFWGLIYGEFITLLQVGCLGIILAGVYLTNK
jgi:drug/metabolite transporter (DMT)-like permease